MITGYNTDVPHSGAVLHVQTEDKGVGNPVIESVVYVGGQVVTAKRVNYSSLLSEGKGEKEIATLMDHQHRTMIAAIRSGRFDEKLDILLPGRARAAGAGGSGGAGGDGSAPEAEGRGEEPSPVEVGPTLDQVILDYLSTEAEHEQLVLALDGQQEIAPGRRAALTLRACSSKSGMPVAGAQVTVKMLSTIADPRTLVAGETDDLGCLDLLLDIPQFDGGTAALIISAASDLGRAEIKHLL